jgi:hypothetical protein
MKKITSEFGKGFVYHLILFAKHWMVMDEIRKRYKEEGHPNDFYGLWFNGSSDHLYETEVPKIFTGTKIEKMTRELQDLALEIGHGSRMMDNSATREDFNKVFELTEEIALEVDKFFKVEPVEADYK